MSIKNNFAIIESIGEAAETPKGQIRAYSAMASYAYFLKRIAIAAEELRNAQKNNEPHLDALEKNLDDAIEIASRTVSIPSHGY